MVCSLTLARCWWFSFSDSWILLVSTFLHLLLPLTLAICSRKSSWCPPIQIHCSPYEQTVEHSLLNSAARYSNEKHAALRQKFLIFLRMNYVLKTEYHLFSIDWSRESRISIVLRIITFFFVGCNSFFTSCLRQFGTGWKDRTKERGDQTNKERSINFSMWEYYYSCND